MTKKMFLNNKTLKRQSNMAKKRVHDYQLEAELDKIQNALDLNKYDMASQWHA